ncbi:ABC transporter permease [Pseudobutyrivibrio ruminis]|uniref:ABC transporter permease n=1 Tax=Pseudobutyrivibrio ruminis TaxID=46206 RepID=UPI0003F76BEC|nr:ABC transporter permease [Pseudobutyrivibrio ruminis]
MQYGIKQYIFVIRELTAREIKRKYSRSVLGILWSVLQPMLFMVVMTMVFSGFTMKSTDYAVYYLTGFTLWTMFNVSTTTAMTVFEDNKNLFQKTKIPREVFVLSRDYTALVNLGFSTIALVIVLIVVRVKLTWTVIFFPLAVLLELAFSIGVSFFLASIYVFYKDILFIWRNIIVLLIHMVAIFYPIEKYPASVQKITLYNPLFIYPDVARKSLLYGTYDLVQIKLMTIWAIGVLIVGLSVFKLLENSIVKKL